MGRRARFICDVHNHDGSPFAGDPRYVLKRALRQAEDMGYSFNVGPELEFFLFHLDEKGRPTTHTGDEAGYFDLGPLDRGENARQEICLALEKMGFEIETSHHELAAGQHEIDFKYAGALETADRIMTFKLAVKPGPAPSPARHLHAQAHLRHRGLGRAPICRCAKTAKTPSLTRQAACSSRTAPGSSRGSRARAGMAPSPTPVSS